MNRKRFFVQPHGLLFLSIAILVFVTLADLIIFHAIDEILPGYHLSNYITDRAYVVSTIQQASFSLDCGNRAAPDSAQGLILAGSVPFSQVSAGPVKLGAMPVSAKCGQDSTRTTPGAIRCEERLEPACQ